MKRNLRLTAGLLALLLLAGCSTTGSQPEETPQSTPSAVVESTPQPEPTPERTPEPTPTPTPEPTPEPTPQIEYELYYGQVPHIFTHCLIAYPELKDGSGKMRYDPDCINVTEFKNLLNELYANGYSLVDIHDIYQQDENGVLTMKEAVEVPVGRKPVVFSIDDVVYDYDKRGNGMVDLLALDEQGNLVSGTYLADGTIEYSYDRDVFPILEAFIAEHPDFSSHGARVTLCMTGFAGVFGYRTEEGDWQGDRQAEIEKATAVANRLKELGYTFASHSYGHYNHEKHSVSSLRADLQAFQDEVVPIIGEVSVYVYPYGKLLMPADERYKVMQEYGFDLFCSVSHFFFSRDYESGDTLYMTRVAIDGYSLRNYQTVLAPLFDTEKVIDHANRP